MNFTFKSAPCGNGILLEEYVGTKKTASRWLSTEEYESLRQVLNNSISITETNAENATPKFKVGDWIVGIDDEGDMATEKIVSFSHNKVLLLDTDGCHTEYPKTELNGFHLWSIADAKDGDVLVCYSEVKGNPIEQAGIFRQYVGQHGGCSNTFLAHTGIDWDGNIIINGYMGSTNILPATKEQRDLLFSKMKEAGYQWDAEKKELCKIIEPNFKVGNWITDGISKCQIHFIDNTQYWYSENCILGSIESVNKRYHLWSIEDAKDGDVLVTTKIRNCPFIYRKNVYDNNLAYYYAGIDGNGDFCEGCIKRTLTHFGSVADVIPATKEQRDLLFKKMKEAGYQWDADKKELCKIIESKFKVRGWVVYNGASVWQVDRIDRNMPIPRYELTNNDGDKLSVPFTSEYNLKEWTIQDAKDGDVLVCYREVKGNPIEQAGIFFGKYAGRSNGFLAHTGIDWDGNIIKNGYMGSTNILPATKEQRDLMFKKMREAGYEWDAENKELKKIPKHYDIKNFHAGMPVLVRDYDEGRWQYVQYSHYCFEDEEYHFRACGKCWAQCIPFNEETKHLLGTTDMPSEEFINW